MTPAAADFDCFSIPDYVQSSSSEPARFECCQAAERLDDGYGRELDSVSDGLNSDAVHGRLQHQGTVRCGTISLAWTDGVRLPPLRAF